MSVAFKITNLTVAYERNVVVENVTVEFQEGKLTAIVGPNGAGKSTLIKAGLHLIPRVTGSMSAFGKEYKGASQRVGYVPQRESVDWDFPVSVMDVTLMGTYGRLGWFQRPGKNQISEAESALEKVGMADYRDRQISQLSGGQQQRVFLARALAQHADLYFMDEPFAGVDAATEKAIIEVLHTLRSDGKTVVAVHHELDTVKEYFDEVLLLNRSLIACGPCDSIFTIDNLRKTYGTRLAFLAEEATASADL